MGLSLQFVIGDKTEILNAVRHFDFDVIEKLESENKLADFSLHLIADDLNLLVKSANEELGEEPFGLREHLDFSEHFVDSEDGGATLVNQRVSVLFSRFDKNQANELAIRWVEKMEKAHQEEIGVNPHIVNAIERLIEISKISVDQKLDLVHIWFT